VSDLALIYWPASIRHKCFRLLGLVFGKITINHEEALYVSE